MTIWQKVSSAVLGATKTGPFSAALDALSLGSRPVGGDPQHDVRFTIALIALCAKMARADGAVTQDEVAAFHRIVEVPPGEAANMRRLFDLAKQDTAGFESYARRIGKLLDDAPQLRSDVLEGLFVIAVADGVLHEKEDAFLRIVAKHMHVEPSDFEFIRALFVRDGSSPYIVLGIEPSASDAAIKKRHRKLVVANHPDRLTGRGVPPEFIAIAERKLATINAAFDAIVKERGLKERVT